MSRVLIPAFIVAAPAAGTGSERIVADHLILAAEIPFIAEVTSPALHALFGAGYRSQEVPP